MLTSLRWIFHHHKIAKEVSYAAVSHLLQVSVAFLPKVTKGFIILQQQKNTLYGAHSQKNIHSKALKKTSLKTLYQLTVTYSSKEQPQALRVLINILDVS